jgi:hypothetical protein
MPCPDPPSEVTKAVQYDSGDNKASYVAGNNTAQIMIEPWVTFSGIKKCSDDSLWTGFNKTWIVNRWSNCGNPPASTETAISVDGATYYIEFFTWGAFYDSNCRIYKPGTPDDCVFHAGFGAGCVFCGTNVSAYYVQGDCGNTCVIAHCGGDIVGYEGQVTFNVNP